MNDLKYTIQSRQNMQPREKALSYGISVLNDRELLKILIGSGQKNRSVDKIAEDVLSLLDSNNEMPEPEELMSIPGMGMARSSLLTAALEFSRRHYLTQNTRITHPELIFNLLSHMADRKQEYFFTISLNGAHEHIKTRQISQGLVNRTIVHPREVFADPITDRAAALCLAHNHPSGSLVPSPEDRDITRRLVEVGDLLGIPVLDHIIFSSRGYFSFMEQGEMG
ncbi:MAG: DNA repair protein RadC [Spirochaetales bacterium]|nr:DNA repair protein RadC [Spirochaetales bacterium]